jgi:transcriptional regulator with XRE-family HTH domain
VVVFCRLTLPFEIYWLMSGRPTPNQPMRHSLAQTAILTDALKHLLKARGMTYANVAAELGLSEAAIKRAFSRRAFTLERLESICDLAGISFFDLARHAEEATQTRPATLSDEQEQALVDTPMLVFVFHLVLGGWTVERIIAEYEIGEAELLPALVKLDRLGLIALMPNNVIRLTTQRSIEYRKGGPMRRMFEASVKAEFLDQDFNAADAIWEFEIGELSEASRALVNRRIGQLFREIRDLIGADAILPLSVKQNTGILVALTPIPRPLMTRDLHKNKR